LKVAVSSFSRSRAVLCQSQESFFSPSFIRVGLHSIFFESLGVWDFTPVVEKSVDLSDDFHEFWLHF
jgi:hypothetical protein